MTFERKIKQYLEDNGMFPSQATEVFETMRIAKENNVMANRWQDNPSDYPTPVFNICIVSARRHALIWIDENCPEAWYRPVFV